MARGALALGAAVAALVLGPLVAVALRAGEAGRLGPGDWAAVRFTVQQAALSAGLSVALAVPLARALARRRFPGRAALVTLMGAPFILPTIVAVFGLIGLFGRSGLVNGALAAVGLPPVSIYGLQGVVLAHVFLNLPLATRMILQGWAAVPPERFRLAESLGFGPREIFRHLEAPLLREIVPGALVAIFVVCLTSFAVALTLGGGPAATTVELAIYQALRFDADLGRAALLASLQVGLAAGAALAAWALVRPAAFGAGLGRGSGLPAPGGWRRVADAAVIACGAAFLLAPLALVAARGLPGLAALPPEVWAAASRSLGVALASAALTMALALALSLGAARGGREGAVLDATAMLPLASSSLVLGTGLFLIVQPWVAPGRVALPVTVLANAALSLPFVHRLLLPEARALRADYGPLADSLGMTGLARLRLLTLPRLARPLGFGTGLAAALSMGDLGAIALFAGDREATLPLMVQRLMGAYRMEAAASAALLLVALSLGLFWIFDRGGRRAAA